MRTNLSTKLAETAQATPAAEEDVDDKLVLAEEGIKLSANDIKVLKQILNLYYTIAIPWSLISRFTLTAKLFITSDDAVPVLL